MMLRDDEIMMCLMVLSFKIAREWINLAVANVGIMLGFMCFFKVLNPSFSLLVSYEIQFTNVVIYLSLISFALNTKFPSQIPKTLSLPKTLYKTLMPFHAFYPNPNTLHTASKLNEQQQGKQKNNKKYKNVM